MSLLKWLPQCGQSFRANVSSKWYFRGDGGVSSMKKKESWQGKWAKMKPWRYLLKVVGYLKSTCCQKDAAQWWCIGSAWSESREMPTEPSLDGLESKTWGVSTAPSPHHSPFQLWPALLVVLHARRCWRGPSSKPSAGKTAWNWWFYMKVLQCSVFHFGFYRFLLHVAIKILSKGFLY